jgi:hypothetical protein
MIISSTKKIVEVTKEIVEATNEMVDLTKATVLMTEMIFSEAKKIMSAAEAIFAVTKTMVFVTQIIIAEANKMLSVAKKMLFVRPTVPCARQPVHCGMGRSVAVVNRAPPVNWFLLGAYSYSDCFLSVLRKERERAFSLFFDHVFSYGTHRTRYGYFGAIVRRFAGDARAGRCALIRKRILRCCPLEDSSIRLALDQSLRVHGTRIALFSSD